MARTAFSFRSHLRRLLVEHDGIATVEFAFILPFMLVLLLGTVEVGNAITAHRAVTAATQTAANFVSQERNLSDAEVANTFLAVNQILNPADPAAVSATIYSVSMANKPPNTVAVDWVETSGLNPVAATANVPAGLLAPGDSIIVAKVTYAHKTVFGDIVLPMVGSFIAGTIEMEQEAYLRPRRGKSVKRTK